MRDLTEVEKLVRIIDNSVELEKETHKVSWAYVERGNNCNDEAEKKTLAMICVNWKVLWRCGGD
jgi:hypothetical protein